MTHHTDVDIDAAGRAPGSTAASVKSRGVHDEVIRDEVHPRPVDVTTNARQDQVRWGPVWAGVVTALATFLLLEVVFFALGWLTLGEDLPGGSNSVAWMTSVAGAVAFLAGGLVAGMTAMWSDVKSGLLHGILVWALGMVSIVLVTLLGGGALFGAFSGVLGQINALQNALGQGNANIPASAISTARDMAGWAVLALVVFIAASGLGGMLGAKMWRPEKSRKSVDVR